MTTIARDVGTGLVRALVIRLVAVAIGGPLGLIWVLTTIWLVVAFEFSPWVLLLVALMWAAPVALLMVLQVGVIWWRARKLDALFVPLGLEGGAYMTHFRRYRGVVSGRQADLRLWRGPALELEIATPLCTRLGITQRQADTSFFAELAGQRPLTLSEPGLAGLSVFALDETWSRGLLADTATAAAVRRLTALNSGIFTRQQLVFRPQAISLLLTGNRRIFGIDITPGQARRWMDDLCVVAQAAEALPAPTVTGELSSGEQIALRQRDRNPYLALWAGLGILGFFAVAAVVIFGGVFLFAAFAGH